MAGSLGLNKRFEQAVKELVGDEVFLKLSKTKGFERAVLQFDKTIKPAFCGHSNQEYYVNFPLAELADDKTNNLVSNTWVMTEYVTCCRFDINTDSI